MTFEALVVGAIAAIIGAAFTFWGWRFFLILLPIWGFLIGFLVGADIMAALFGDGFLATTAGWVVGFVLGLVFGVLSYLYYWFAIVMIGASAGYALGLGVMGWLGSDGFLAFVVGVIVAVIGAAIFIVLRVPKFLVLGATAFGGAFALMSGIALALGRVPLRELQNGTVGAYVKDDLSWLWVAVAILVGIAGFFYQWMTTSGMAFVSSSDYRNPGMPAEEYASDDRGARDRPM